MAATPLAEHGHNTPVPESTKRPKTTEVSGRHRIIFDPSQPPGQDFGDCVNLFNSWGVMSMAPCAAASPK